MDIKQEIEWLKEEIEQDELIEQTSDFTSFHQQRLDENRAELAELMELYENPRRS